MTLLLQFQTYLQILIYLQPIHFSTFKLDIVPLLFFHIFLPSPLINHWMTFWTSIRTRNHFYPNSWLLIIILFSKLKMLGSMTLGQIWQINGGIKLWIIYTQLLPIPDHSFYKLRHYTESISANLDYPKYILMLWINVTDVMPLLVIWAICFSSAQGYINSNWLIYDFKKGPRSPD